MFKLIVKKPNDKDDGVSRGERANITERLWY